jgi:hypothetical protein
MRRAENELHSPEEVRISFGAAAQRDLPQRAVDVVRATISEGSLFPVMRRQTLEALRGDYPGLASVDLLVNCAVVAVMEGRSGERAVREIVSQTLSAVSTAQFNGMVEHAAGAAAADESERIIARLHDGFTSSDFDQLATERLLPPEERRRRRKPSRVRGIDDGPPL